MSEKTPNQSQNQTVSPNTIDLRVVPSNLQEQIDIDGGIYDQAFDIDAQYELSMNKRSKKSKQSKQKLTPDSVDNNTLDQSEKESDSEWFKESRNIFLAQDILILTKKIKAFEGDALDSDSANTLDTKKRILDEYKSELGDLLGELFDSKGNNTFDFLSDIEIQNAIRLEESLKDFSEKNTKRSLRKFGNKVLTKALILPPVYAAHDYVQEKIQEHDYHKNLRTGYRDRAKRRIENERAAKQN
jgi:hypothetical protein